MTRRQMSLFGDEPAPERPTRRRVEPASVPPELRALAAALPETLRLGTSSWSFPGWAGLVYAREHHAKQLAGEGLFAYARHPLLRSVGVDRTFYAPIPASTFRTYAEATPDGFRFLVKAPSLCTTPAIAEARGPTLPNARYLDASFAADEVLGPLVEGLGAKAGPLVFQFPPQGPALRDPALFVERLGRFLEALPRGPLLAVELRDAGVLGPGYRAMLASCGATHCISLHPRMPGATEQWRDAVRAEGPLVVRWMLRPGLGYEEARRRYAPFSTIVDEDGAARAAVAELALDHALSGRDVFVIANNKAEGSAPITLVRLAERIAARRRERVERGA